MACRDALKSLRHAPGTDGQGYVLAGGGEGAPPLGIAERETSESERVVRCGGSRKSTPPKSDEMSPSFISTGILALWGSEMCFVILCTLFSGALMVNHRRR